MHPQGCRLPWKTWSSSRTSRRSIGETTVLICHVGAVAKGVPVTCLRLCEKAGVEHPLPSSLLLSSTSCPLSCELNKETPSCSPQLSLSWVCSHQTQTSNQPREVPQDPPSSQEEQPQLQAASLSPSTPPSISPQCFLLFPFDLELSRARSVQQAVIALCGAFPTDSMMSRGRAGASTIEAKQEASPTPHLPIK